MDSINQLKCDGQAITDKESIANQCCKYFLRLNYESLIDSKEVLLLGRFVPSLLTWHQSTKATGLDGLPSRLLKDSAVTISVLITHIINLSITTQCIPHVWKHAKAIPLFKDGVRDDIDNYRPISILPVVSKILERAVQQQLVDHLESHNHFSRYQCGFRRKHSTQSAITLLTDSIRRNMDAGQLTGAIFVDFRKAFDTIDYKILLDKLQLFGIRDNEHRWMSDYLNDRTQSVFVGGVLSQPQQVVSGVPQGSILGPLLLSLHVTDLPNCLQAANVLTYADDTVIYYAASDANQPLQVLFLFIYLFIYFNSNFLLTLP